MQLADTVSASVACISLLYLLLALLYGADENKRCGFPSRHFLFAS